MNFLVALAVFIVLTSTVGSGDRIQWIPTTEANVSLLEVGGREDHEGTHTNLFVVRAPHLGGLIPGKYSDATRRGYFPYNGNQLMLTDYEFLSFPRATLSWIPTSTNLSSTIENMVVGGIRPGTSELTFLCRAWEGDQQNDLMNGKLIPSTGLCYIPTSDGEQIASEYEVLAINSYGIATNLTTG